MEQNEDGMDSNLLEYEETSQLKPTAVVSKLSLLDRLLPVWILLAMILGVSLSFIPNIQHIFMAFQINRVSLPIALGLLWMMFPVLAKVHYEELGSIVLMKQATKQFGTSLVLNWIVGPILLTAFAWICLPDQPEYRTGIILVGLARCIAMVLIWNMLAGGSGEFCAVLVALNSVFQIIMYSPLAYFYLDLLPRVFGGSTTDVNVAIGDIAISVLVFLGIPLAAGVTTRFALRRAKGDEWYDSQFLPRLGPTSLIGLLFTIVVMFSLQGRNLVFHLLDVLRISIPLFMYFVTMFTASFGVSKYLNFSYEISVTQAFTATGNNFELAIAVAVATFGIDSKQALATIIGPLIEVPVLIGLVYASLWFQKRFYLYQPTSQ